jgi:hypothetical protein
MSSGLDLRFASGGLAADSEIGDSFRFEPLYSHSQINMVSGLNQRSRSDTHEPDMKFGDEESLA